MEISLVLIPWQISGFCVSFLAYWILASFFVNFFISLLWCICGSFATNYKIDFMKKSEDKKDSDSEFEDKIPLTGENILIDELDKRNDLNRDNSEPQIKCRNVIRHDEKPREEEMFINKIDFTKNGVDKKDSYSEFEDNIPLTGQNTLIDEMEKQNVQNRDNSEPQIKCRNVIRHDKKPGDEEMFIDKGNEECKINKKTGGSRSSLKKVIIYCPFHLIFRSFGYW